MSANGPSDDEVERNFNAHGGKSLRAPTEAELQHMRDNWPHAELPLTKDFPEAYENVRTFLKVAHHAAGQVEKELSVSLGATIIQIAQKGMATPAAPPSTFLLDLLMAGNDAKDASANLEELLPYWEGKHGSRKARLIFRVQAGYVLAGYWWNRGMNMVERVLNSVNVFTGIRGG